MQLQLEPIVKNVFIYAMIKPELDKIKLVAVDMDGTLLDDEKNISRRTKECLGQLIRRGIDVVIITGRSYEALKPYKDELGLETPVICYNGSQTVDGKTGKILRDEVLPDESSRYIIELARREDIHVQAYKNGTLYFERRRPESDHYESHVNLKGEIVDFDSMNPLNFTKMMYVGSHERLAGVMRKVEADIGDKTSVMFSNVEFLEFMKKGISKGEALNLLLSDMGIDPADTIAFGDGDNDVSLLEAAGIGVAMGNASEAVKAAADFVTDSNNEDGIARFLSSLCFIKRI